MGRWNHAAGNKPHKKEKTIVDPPWGTALDKEDGDSIEVMKKKQAQRDDLKKEYKDKSLKEMCDWFASKGIPTVEFEYSGYGDSGEIENCSVTSGDKLYFYDTNAGDHDNAKFFAELLKDAPEFMSFYQHNVSRVDPMTGGSWEMEYISRGIFETLEDIVYDFLPPGFEVNEGGQGSITLDVNGRKLNTSHQENYTHYSTTETSIEV